MSTEHFPPIMPFCSMVMRWEMSAGWSSQPDEININFLMVNQLVLPINFAEGETESWDNLPETMQQGKTGFSGRGTPKAFTARRAFSSRANKKCRAQSRWIDVLMWTLTCPKVKAWKWRRRGILEQLNYLNHFILLKVSKTRCLFLPSITAPWPFSSVYMHKESAHVLAMECQNTFLLNRGGKS